MVNLERPLRPAVLWGSGLGAIAVVALGVGAWRIALRRPAPLRAEASPAMAMTWEGLGVDMQPSILRVPYAPGSIVLDGDTDDPGWTSSPGPARTGGFLLRSGAVARPHSETRLVWGDGYLYLALYAADEDIRSRKAQPDGPLWLDDSFQVTFRCDATVYLIEVSPKGVVTDAIRTGDGPLDYSWSSGVHVSTELDGTVNDSSDEDEEWGVEMAVPLESLGLKGKHGESIGLSLRRCDQPKEGGRICAGWGQGAMRGAIVLD